MEFLQWSERCAEPAEIQKGRSGEVTETGPVVAVQPHICGGLWRDLGPRSAWRRGVGGCWSQASRVVRLCLEPQGVTSATRPTSLCPDSCLLQNPAASRVPATSFSAFWFLPVLLGCLPIPGTQTRGRSLTGPASQQQDSVAPTRRLLSSCRSCLGHSFVWGAPWVGPSAVPQRQRPGWSTGRRGTSQSGPVACVSSTQ